MAAFLFGVFCGFLVGWIVCALMVHAGRESDSFEREHTAASRVTVAHRPECRTQQPGFVIPTLPDGTVDMSAPQQCDCDFAARLREELDL